MSELDKYFGSAPDVSMPPAQVTHFGRYPDVQDLCDIFLSEMDWNHDAYTVQHVVAGARDFKLAIGNSPAKLLRAIQKMKRDKLTIASPRSCITTARKITPDADSIEGRRRYIEGPHADFFDDGGDDG